MMKPLRSPVFYPVLFALWAGALFFRYGHYRYFDKPFPTSGYEYNNAGGIFKPGYLQNILFVLKTHFIYKAKPQDLPHLLANIGTGYFDLYKVSRDRKVLDTVILYLLNSVKAAPNNPRFHYNLGLAFSEAGDHEQALHHYEQTIALDPSHVPALSNAAQTAYFVFDRKEIAARYLSQALAVDSLTPMCHLILGFIHASNKNFTEAVKHFEAEIATGQNIAGNSSDPASQMKINEVAALARFNLFTLYSQQVRDRKKASLNYNEYMRLEQDGKKRSEALAAFRKYWGNEPR